jgi:hypothetical protein
MLTNSLAFGLSSFNMSIKKKIQYPNIGTVNYTYKKGCKRITLRIKKEGSIHVTIPYLVKFSQAEGFVLSKKDWIISKLNEVNQKQQPITSFRTKFSSIKTVLSNSVSKVSVVRNNNNYTVYYPSTLSINDDNLQSFLKKLITEILRKEAKNYLPKRIDYIAKRYNFSYNKVTIRNSKTRWGSCSGKNNISLSLWLMLVPYHLIDYVILHELCHTKVKNHGKDFWQLLDMLCDGNARIYSKELKGYQIPF